MRQQMQLLESHWPEAVWALLKRVIRLLRISSLPFSNFPVTTVTTVATIKLILQVPFASLFLDFTSFHIVSKGFPARAWFNPPVASTATAVWISGRASDFDGDGCEALNMVSHGFAMFHICSTCFSIFDIPLFHLFHTLRPTFCGNMADLGFCCLQDGVEDQDRDNDGVEDRMDRWTWPRVEWVGRWNCLFQSAESAEIIEIITLASANR
jgi:hypothetical protein